MTQRDHDGAERFHDHLEHATHLERPEKELKGRAALEQLVPGIPGLIHASVGEFLPRTSLAEHSDDRPKPQEMTLPLTSVRRSAWERTASGSHSNSGALNEPDDEVKWLTADQFESWLSVVRLMTWKNWSIDQEL
jgi:hypothetical protein